MLLLKEMKADIIKEMKKTEEAIKEEMKTNNEAIKNKVNKIENNIEVNTKKIKDIESRVLNLKNKNEIINTKDTVENVTNANTKRKPISDLGSGWFK